MHHPNIVETLFVMSDNFMRMGVMGMTNPVYGEVQLRVFDTVEAALSYCRERIAEQAHS